MAIFAGALGVGGGIVNFAWALGVKYGRDWALPIQEVENR